VRAEEDAYQIALARRAGLVEEPAQVRPRRVQTDAQPVCHALEAVTTEERQRDPRLGGQVLTGRKRNSFRVRDTSDGPKAPRAAEREMEKADRTCGASSIMIRITRSASMRRPYSLKNAGRSSSRCGISCSPTATFPAPSVRVTGLRAHGSNWPPGSR
jgi:hypothetical protein